MFVIQSISADQRNALLQVLDDRYASKSTIITSQLPIGIHSLINKLNIVNSNMDRLTANTHSFDLKSKSIRNKFTTFDN